MWNFLQPIRPGERRELVSSLLTLFTIMAGHSLLETARDALFLASIPPQRLPWIYLCLALVALALTLLQRRGAGRIPGRISLSIFLLASGVLTLVLWQFVVRGERAALFLLYGWTGVFSTVALIRFWLLVSDIFTVTQAKRIFPLIGAGSVAGAIAGSALARYLATEWGSESVLLAGAAVIVLSSLPPLLIPTSSLHYGVTTPIATSFAAWKADFRLVMQEPYVRRVALFIWITTMMLTLVDYIFKSTVAELIPSYALGSFFAGAYLVLNILSLFVQVFLVGFIVRRLGVIRALLVMPVLLVLGSVGIVLGGGITAALLLKGGDAALRHSLHRTAIETLYVPLPSDLRNRLKGLIDAGGQRGGQAVASLLILGLLALGAGNEILAVCVILLGIFVLLLGMELRSHYLDIFRATLHEGEAPARSGVPELDIASLETLMATLNSSDDSEVLATLDLLAEQDRVRLIPALILYHPSTEVVLQALEIFGKWGREDFLSMMPRLMQHADPLVRGAALRAGSGVDPDAELLLNEFLDDEDAAVRATALVGLVNAGGIEESEGQRAIAQLMKEASAGEQIALARAIWHQPSDVFVPILLELIKDADPQVRLELARAMEEVGHSEFLPWMLEMLADRRLRETARRGLVRMGDEALEYLDLALRDPQLSVRVRRHIPRTISRFGGEEAAEILLAHYLEEPDGRTRFKILRALGRMRTDDPEIRLDGAVLRRATTETVEVVCRLLGWQLNLQEGARRDPHRATPTHELLLQMLQDKEARAMERLFRLLGLQYGMDDMYRIHRGLRSSRREVRAGSRELLEHLVPLPLRDAVLSLVDDLPMGQRLSGARAYYRQTASSYQDTVAQILGARSSSLASLAAYHAGELKMKELDASIAELEERSSSSSLREVLVRARQLLNSPQTERLSYE